jgi:hypothetical protein
MATDLTFPPALLNVYGGWLYWYENSNGQTTGDMRLRAMPTSSCGVGTPVTIDAVSQDAGMSQFPTNIAYDGTDVYWTRNEDSSGGTGLSVVKAAPGSASTTLVATSSTQYLANNDYTNGMIFAGGDLYLHPNSTFLLKITTSGTFTVVQPPTGIDIATPWATDGTNVFFETDSNTDSPSFYAAPLSLASATLLASAPSANYSGGMAVSNGTAFMLSYSSTGSPQTSQLNIASIADGGGGTAVPYTGVAGAWIVADANGVFLGNANSGDATYPDGIYSVSATGTLTFVHSMAGTTYGMALDASNVYWLDIQGLHRVAR